MKELMMNRSVERNRNPLLSIARYQNNLLVLNILSEHMKSNTRNNFLHKHQSYYVSEFL